MSKRFKGRRPPGTYANLLVGDMPPPGKTYFSGKTYDAELDQYRLGTQLNNVWQHFKDGRWHYPEEMEQVLGYRWASISARLRDFRKARCGGHNVERKRIQGGSWKYRLIRDE